MVETETQTEILFELLGIINTYFFDLPKAVECFKYYSSVFQKLHTFLKGDHSSMIDLTLRIIKNQLLSGMSKSKDFDDVTIIDDLG